jgi:hypothetical protein
MNQILTRSSKSETIFYVSSNKRRQVNILYWKSQLFYWHNLIEYLYLWMEPYVCQRDCLSSLLPLSKITAFSQSTTISNNIHSETECQLRSEHNQQKWSCLWEAEQLVNSLAVSLVWGLKMVLPLSWCSSLLTPRSAQSSDCRQMEYSSRKPLQTPSRTAR